MLKQEILDTFLQLLDEAAAGRDPDATAMNLATVDAAGRVSSRIVLLKGADERGFRFYTNYESDKGAQLNAHHQVALCFHWKQLRQGVQVRVEGAARKLLAEESDAYFATRPRASQIGAWASLQSQTLPDRETFEQRFSRYEKEFEGQDVPRPPHWGGFVVEPDMVEFWYGAEYRLHERVRWSRHGQTWTSRLLYP
ncbi:pyridoxine/pyridoxamine 5'-phosphate oxidase [Dyella jiangningensis]|uniref:pyridoxamine 5'-phosphate oxidase n=1 Tax=Dyella jiangningensis TaxID=1379159 RepID=UPI00045634BD|nr:pyridoxamine 5'-phosphate oxidase [Dyella jiangningensis]AHX12211.1 pyridoxine/pyridoxamine 5'-phosphate oxidase [Dyella jiangningensis]MDG2537101.1 pyridoxamine 5'-phosphate oxidase [Dyella jiangningensis]